jgi:3'-phosphoadenosine 5'-phosphosulfate sulfotransferase (PAPS reductase)/FAD synthetase
MNKHMPYDLKQMQSVPLEGKIIMTKQRIRQWYEHWDGQVYVSFSGGKDSTVLKHIVDSMYDDVPALFVNTGLEYPEIQKFAMSQKNVVTVRPKMRFGEVIKKHGYPVISKDVAQTAKTAKYNKNTYRYKKMTGTATDKQGNPSMYNMQKWSFLMDAPFDTSSRCCDVMKKAPIKAYEKQTRRKPIIGTMAQESRNRYVSWMKNGCNAFDAKKPSSQPMSFWTEQDVLHYLKKYNVPYCTVYGDIVVREENEESLNGQITIYDALEDYDEAILETTGCNRTGCIFCMFGCHLEKGQNRFQRLKETHPRQYEYCINGGEMVEGKWQPNKEGLGLGKVLDYIGVKYD